MASEDVRVLSVRRVTTWRSLAFVAQPRRPAEAKPMPAAFAKPEAAQADTVITIVAPLTIVVQLILNVILAA